MGGRGAFSSLVAVCGDTAHFEQKKKNLENFDDANYRPRKGFPHIVYEMYVHVANVVTHELSVWPSRAVQSNNESVAIF